MPSLSRDEVIAAIYAAATEPDALSRIACALRSFFDTDSAGVWMVDNGGISEIDQTPDLVESVHPYLNYYRKLDPWTASRRTPGRVYLGSDSVDENALVRSEFYQDFARHFGMLRPMGLVLPLEPNVAGTIALNRTSSRRLLGEAERGVLQDLAIHLHGALQLRSRILADREADAARGDVFDAVSFGAVVCDTDARVRSANSAASNLVASGVIAFGTSGTLMAGTAEQTHRLQGLIRAAALGQPGAMRLRCVDETMLSVLATPSHREERAVEPRRALVCFRSDDAPASLDAPTLGRLFGFSPRQAELCSRLTAGRTFEQAAAESGIATSTARSYFIVILARTGTKNLRDLLRLLGSLPQVR